MNDFSFETIANFDNHISGSINGYLLLDTLLISLASFWAKKEENIIDLGCTSGRLIHKIQNEYPESKCVGYDLTDNNFIKGKACLYKQDITDKSFIIEPCNLALSIFTLQFLSIEKRMYLLKKVYDALHINGAFIVAEKEISNSGTIQEAFTFANYDYKKKGFTAEEILKKEKDLRKIMNCLTDGENVKLLSEAGFKCHQFFQSLNFKAWICLK